MTFTANKKQWNALEGLSYWIEDHAYIVERYGADDPELPKVDDTIRSLFEELDSLGVPFWVQNAVIAFSAEWRNTRQYYLDAAMKARNIFTA